MKICISRLTKTVIIAVYVCIVIILYYALFYDFNDITDTTHNGPITAFIFPIKIFLKFINQINLTPDYALKDNLESDINAFLLKIFLLLISIFSSFIVYKKNKFQGNSMLLIFSIFQGLTLSIILNLCICLNFDFDWSLWFQLEYICECVLISLFSYFVVILMSKAFISWKNYYRYNKLEIPMKKILSALNKRPIMPSLNFLIVFLLSSILGIYLIKYILSSVLKQYY